MSEVKEVVKDVFGFQNRVSKTIIDLTLRPGKAISYYFRFIMVFFNLN